jgi:hypothetical protein
MLQWTSEIRVRVAWALRALSAHPHARFVSTLSPHRTANPPFDRIRLRTRPERSFKLSFFQLSYSNIINIAGDPAAVPASIVVTSGVLAVARVFGR